MADDGQVTEYYFTVELDGIETARFQKCEGLEAETEIFEYEEGGGKVHHFQGRSRFPNLILEKGINDNNELFKWFQSINKYDKVERKNGSVVLKNIQGEEIKRWNFFRALPCRWIGPKLNYRDKSIFAVEQIEIAHEGLEVDNDSEPFDFHIGADMNGTKNFVSEMNGGTAVFYDDNGNPSSDPYAVTGRNMGEPIDIPVSEKIANAAENHLDENYADGNSCDEWAAKILSEAGFSPEDYQLGDTSQTVRQHINKLNSTGIDYSTTSNNSAYVVFMGDGTKQHTIGHEHAGLLVMDSDGGVSFYHSSANNKNSLSKKETYPSVSDFEKDFLYSTFYYQEIH